MPTRAQLRDAVPDRMTPGGRLSRLAAIATEAGADEVAREARELAGRVSEGRFYVACVGQFKRGKSTLLNALVGQPVLPTGVVPVTSAVTVMRHGPAPASRVWFADGRSLDVDPSRIGEYVSESDNPGNEKGVRVVEVFLPSPLLEQGMCLVDTPGLGSVFDANSEVTRNFVPHVDAALLVIGADPPISGDELGLVEAVVEKVDHVVLVLNKADRVSSEESEEAARFAAQVLSRRLRRPIGAILRVSAAERLERTTPTRDWVAFERALRTLSAEAGADMVVAAEQRGTVRLTQALKSELEERRAALVRPLDESEARLAILRQSVGEAERALAELRVLLAAEEQRLQEAFRQRQEGFLVTARSEALRELDFGIRGLDAPRRKMRERGYAIAREIAGQAVEKWRKDVEPAAEDMYRKSVTRFVLLANEFLTRVASTGEPGMDGLPRALEPETGFRIETGLYYTHLMYMTTNPIPWVLDLVRSRSRTEDALLRKVGEYLGRILEANSSRVANDLGERVSASRSRLQSQVHASLRRIVEIAAKAIETARERRGEGAAAVQAELARLESLLSRTATLVNPDEEGRRT